MKSQKTAAAADLDNRSRLLRAATDAFAEFGYEGTSLRAIADNAEVSFQLIAYYFGSKEELWIETVDYLFERYLETGKGLGFTPSGNLHEQFHNHLRLLLTDMLQRPQLRKIWIQEYLADSSRYHNVIKPKIKYLYDTLSLPYFSEVVRLGIVEKFTPEETSLLWAAVVQNNVVYPYYVELSLGAAAGSARLVEEQVDLVFAILTERLPLETGAAATEPAAVGPATGDAAARADNVVHVWKDAKPPPDVGRSKQLESENLHLKQLVGNLSLEKKLLLDRLAELQKKA